MKPGHPLTQARADAARAAPFWPFAPLLPHQRHQRAALEGAMRAGQLAPLSRPAWQLRRFTHTHAEAQALPEARE